MQLRSAAHMWGFLLPSLYKGKLGIEVAQDKMRFHRIASTWPEESVWCQGCPGQLGRCGRVGAHGVVINGGEAFLRDFLMQSGLVRTQGSALGSDRCE